MSIKVVKAVTDVGRADDTGLSFPETAFLQKAREAYDATQARVRKEGGVVTGPARVLVTVEQEVLFDGD